MNRLTWFFCNRLSATGQGGFGLAKPAADSGPIPSAMPIIVGAPRSGTTLLRLMLDAHPELAIPPETGFLVPAAHLQGQGEGLRQQFFQLLTEYPKIAPNWPDFQIPAADFWQTLLAIEPFSVTAGLRAFYRHYANRFNKTGYGDKTPVYAKYMFLIEAVLPEAFFIHLIRDGRDVALSWRPLWFSPGKRLEVLALQWVRWVVMARRQGAHCRHYLEVHYEDLVRNPEKVLRLICSFLGLAYQESMLQYYQRAPERLQEHQSRIRADGSVIVSRDERLSQQVMTTRPLDSSRIGAWKKGLTTLERWRFELIAQKLLRDCGYEVSATIRPASLSSLIFWLASKLGPS